MVAEIWFTFAMTQGYNLFEPFQSPTAYGWFEFVVEVA
jgi:hypothetical protein